MLVVYTTYQDIQSAVNSESTFHADGLLLYHMWMWVCSAVKFECTVMWVSYKQADSVPCINARAEWQEASNYMNGSLWKQAASASSATKKLKVWNVWSNSALFSKCTKTFQILC